MTSDLFPYIALRRKADGTIRPRFAPGPRERALGFVAEDLKHESGGWFSLDEVARFAGERKAAIVAARQSGKRVKPVIEAPRGKTVNDLVDAFLRSEDVRRLAAVTQHDYQRRAKAIRWKPRVVPRAADMSGATRRERERQAIAMRPSLVPEGFGMAPATAIRPPEVKAFFEYLVKARGLATARGTIAVLSAAFKWGRLSADWRLGINPCYDLDLPSPPPDLKVFAPAEVTQMRIVGDATGDECVVDAMILALLSGQRPTDVLAFTGGAIGESETGFPVVRLIQSKTGKRVELPAIRALRERLALMASRRQANGWADDRLAIDDRTGKGFTPREFNARWRALVAKAAAGVERLGLLPMPSLAGKKFKYLRKTTITWLHKAGNDLPSIGSVSGHAIASMPQIAKHYLDLDAATAAVAMGRVETWLDEKGVKLSD
jgi:integrase